MAFATQAASSRPASRSHAIWARFGRRIQARPCTGRSPPPARRSSSRAANPNIDPAVVHSPANHEWGKKGLPLCLIGDSGTGESHLMIALGTEAARHGRVDLLRIDLSRRCDYAGNGARLGHNRTVVHPSAGIQAPTPSLRWNASAPSMRTCAVPVWTQVGNGRRDDLSNPDRAPGVGGGPPVFIAGFLGKGYLI